MGPQLPVLSSSTQPELLVPLGGPWPGPQAAKPPRGLESEYTYSSLVLVPFWGHDCGWINVFLEFPEVSRSTLRNHLKGGLMLGSDGSDTSLPSCTCDVISCLVAHTAFPFAFVIVSCHWQVFVIVSYISLCSKPARKQTTQLDIVLHAQQDLAMHKLLIGIK